MIRLLLIIVLLGVAAYFTKPARVAHEAAANAVVEAPRDADGEAKLTDQAVGFVRGLFAGDGRFEDFYLASHYTADLPGADYVECWGAFAYVHCAVVEPASE